METIFRNKQGAVFFLGGRNKSLRSDEKIGQKCTVLLHMFDTERDKMRNERIFSLMKTAQTGPKHLIYKKREKERGYFFTQNY